ncbi:hypothetical protein F5X71_29810 [Nocardia brasiliensis]|uniref:Uncharacterized protein n=1 Tax=Nocardia brasiliensis TaxID=37326 RepID=A0A6G9XYM0_NOCBR|nr:hypothetical protein [Nocardia brasiliensis]QIS05947.1 hypothetical protein F5X71_29810 [Nocardia brasiliensis]
MSARTVHLQIALGGVVLHYAASADAAEALIADEQMHHYLDEIAVIPGAATGLVRLPCEQLYDPTVESLRTAMQQRNSP